MRLGISLSIDFSAFSSFRRETCESTSLSALIFVPFQEQRKVWRGFYGEIYNLIAATGLLGGLSPRSALQRLLRLWLRRRSGLRPLQGSNQASNLKKKRQAFVSDPSDISFCKRQCPETERMRKNRSVVLRPDIFVRCIVLFLSFFFFFDTVRCLFKRKREVWRGTPWWKS